MARLTPDVQDQRFIRRLALLLVALALVMFVYKAADLLLLVFGAMLGAVLLSAVADWIAAHGPFGRRIGLTAAIGLLLVVLGLMAWLFGAEMSGQVERLGSQLPKDWQQIETTLGAHPIGRMLLASGRQLAEGSHVATIAVGAGYGSVEILVNFLIILIGAIFFAAQPDLYRRGLVRLAPPAYRPVAADAVDDVGQALRLWLLTQIISMTMMGVMIGVGLWLAGVDAPAALGLLGGLSEFIPYVGPTLAMVPAVVVALAGKGAIWGVLGTYAAVRIVQANIITPLISQELIHVPPGVYLFLILACGYAFGTFGLFFSGALAVTACTLVSRLYGCETLGDGIRPPDEA